ncbi:MazG-like family protein [Nocardioides pantholopis]|uniref:MazG-like family protein n=1 Tax=Nocardioides pantholopis TaxID=2483798 RepID=UPI003B97A398
MLPVVRQRGPERLRNELADVLTNCLLLADRLGLDPDTVVMAKFEEMREGSIQPRRPAVGARNMTNFGLSVDHSLSAR